jgi:hypothetical protein
MKGIKYYLSIISVCAFVVVLVALAKKVYDSRFGQEEVSETETTLIGVTNSSDSAVTAYLTLNVGDNFVDNVNGIFGISSEKNLQGSFTLNPKDTLWYESSKIMSGNLTFNNPPLNCPVGITQYEFTLNNFGSAPKAQETIDISCVAGVSTIGKFSVFGGGKWTNGVDTTSVTEFQNNVLDKNTNVTGVYPYGCTNCTFSHNPPKCVDTSKVKPSDKPICNVQRSANESGGKVLVVYMSKID